MQMMIRLHACLLVRSHDQVKPLGRPDMEMMAMSILPGGQLTLLEPLGDLARGQPSPIEPGGLAGEVLLFIKS